MAYGESLYAVLHNASGKSVKHFSYNPHDAREKADAWRRLNRWKHAWQASVKPENLEAALCTVL